MGTGSSGAHRGGSRGPRPVLAPTLLVLTLLLATCTSSPRPSRPASPGGGPTTASTGSATTSPAPTATGPIAAPSTQSGPGPPSPGHPGTERGTTLALRIESRVADQSTAAFRSRVAAVLTDPRGWRQAGFDFVFDHPEAPYRLVLAEGPEVDRLCRPYETAGRYSCQNGPVIALNADRWRTATPDWPGSLEDYRTMLVNHEVGHLLHLHHPRPQCPGPGLPAPVMMQQSSGPGECVANPWPLRWEIDLAARRAEPLAPPADHDVSDHRPSPPAARS